MRIGLIDVDGHNGYPNLALMKISQYHKNCGDEVEWAQICTHYDIIYASKIFSFTPDWNDTFFLADTIIRGGTGYGEPYTSLHEEIDRLQPDYSLYPEKIDHRTAYGFITRGCPNKCYWCVVPKNEGKIYPYMDVDDIAQGGKRPWLVLMDNNVLACDYGIEQLQKIVDRGYHVDFNQGLDARLVTPEIAALLAKVKWIKNIRFGCDTPKQVEECQRVVDMIESHGSHTNYLFYTMLHGEVEECYERLTHWAKAGNRFNVQAQPYINLQDLSHRPPQWQKDMARWANRKQLFHSCDFKDFKPRKNFCCKEYFK